MQASQRCVQEPIRASGWAGFLSAATHHADPRNNFTDGLMDTLIILHREIAIVAAAEWQKTKQNKTTKHRSIYINHIFI